MRVVFRYTRLPKPRGAWNYALKVVFKVDYSTAERAALAPDWSTTTVSWGLAEFVSPERGSSRKWREMPKVHHNMLLDEIVFLHTAEDRETLIKILHRWRDLAVQAHQEFWEKNPPVPGEQEHVRDVIIRDGEVIPEEAEEAEPKVRRRVQAMVGVAS